MSLKNTFASWQNEEVITHRYGAITINKLIHIFLTNGIIPFIKKNGYIFSMSKEYTENSLATILFHLDFNKFYKFKSPCDITFDNEFVNDYLYYPDWETFWKVWNHCTNNFFVDAELEIQILMWTCIDIRKSMACKEYLEDSDVDDEYGNKLKNMDPYLLDQLNATNHYKFTRFENS